MPEVTVEIHTQGGQGLRSYMMFQGSEWVGVGPGGAGVEVSYRLAKQAIFTSHSRPQHYHIFLRRNPTRLLFPPRVTAVVLDDLLDDGGR